MDIARLATIRAKILVHGSASIEGEGALDELCDALEAAQTENNRLHETVKNNIYLLNQVVRLEQERDRLASQVAELTTGIAGAIASTDELDAEMDWELYAQAVRYKLRALLVRLTSPETVDPIEELS